MILILNIFCCIQNDDKQYGNHNYDIKKHNSIVKKCFEHSESKTSDCLIQNKSNLPSYDELKKFISIKKQNKNINNEDQDMGIDKYDYYNLKEEMSIYLNPQDLNKHIDVESIELDKNFYSDMDLEPQSSLKQTEKTQELEYNEKIFSIDKIKKQCVEFKKQIEDFVKKINSMPTLTNRNTNFQFGKNNVKNNKIQNYNSTIYTFTRDNIKIIKNRIPQLYIEIKRLSLPQDINNVLLECVEIFKAFIILICKRENYVQVKNCSVINKRQINNYNIEILSIFDSVPIFDFFESIEEEFKSYKYDIFYKLEKIQNIISIINKNLYCIFRKSKNCIKVYKKINQELEKKILN
ncbi:uncharacterized protein VNE69_12005 [Vairimorpha necatrix]|uniref:Uncharacterized protein n=1 Tax=Vairimorpha necatrix TaxID=6039 RepID=A0AAX4JG54_9MICR